MQYERELDVEILAQLKSLDTRVLRIERYFWMGIGAIGLLQIVLQLFSDYIGAKS